MIIRHRLEQQVGLDIDHTACTGRALCAVVLPERITTDEWGYPVIDPHSIDKRAAAEAVHICPVRALRLR